MLDSRIGWEDLQLAAFETIQAQINDLLDVEEQKGVDFDTRVAAASGVDPTPVSLERFAREHIHYGHRPSLIMRPIEEYPSMSVMVPTSVPTGKNQSVDYGNSNMLKVAVELIVKSGPYEVSEQKGDTSLEGTDLVGRRLKRTAEAVVQLFNTFGNLGGHFEPSTEPITTVSGDIFEREEDGETATGARWYWQGVRIEILYLKQSVQNY